jgi:hypothetical protein
MSMNVLDMSGPSLNVAEKRFCRLTQQGDDLRMSDEARSAPVEDDISTWPRLTVRRPRGRVAGPVATRN